MMKRLEIRLRRMIWEKLKGEGYRKIYDTESFRFFWTDTEIKIMIYGGDMLVFRISLEDGKFKYLAGDYNFSRLWILQRIADEAVRI